jgi:hypothetical protein
MICDTFPTNITPLPETVQIDGCACAILSCEEGRLIYDYDLLIKHFHDHEDMKSLDDYDNEYESAVEWINYNVIRGIPYAGPGILPDIRDDGASVIDCEGEEEEDEDKEE